MPTGSLPSEGKKLFEKVYEQAKKGSCKDDEECAARTAWSAVKGAGWSKDKEGKWHKKALLSEFSLRITKASMDNETGEMRWLAVASDTEPDLANDEMTMELFTNFVDRINKGELVPEEYRSDFWQGGMPYLSVSHYPDLNGDAVPGNVEDVFIDGKYLKAKGTFSDTKIGRACFKSVRRDLLGEKSKNRDDKVRISIAFLDWMHQHKSNGYKFERKSLDEICPECLMELIKGEYDGKKFYKGQLVHLAQTRVPMNERTLMEVEKSMTTRKEDAASIVGEELAEELDEKAKIVGKSAALVIKSEEEEEVSDTSEEKQETPEPLVEEAKTMKEQEKEDEKQDEGEMSDEEKEKLHKKSDVVDELPQRVFAAIEELKSLLAPKEIPAHPLDEVIAKFKSDYDEVIKMEATPDEKLQLIQKPYADIGNFVVETIKSAISTNAETGSGDESKVVKILESLLTRMDLIETKLSQAPAPATQVASPVRRSFQPTPDQMQIKGLEAKPEQSDTPNLRKLLKGTV